MRSGDPGPDRPKRMLRVSPDLPVSHKKRATPSAGDPHLAGIALVAREARARWAGRAAARPSEPIAAEESGRRLARAVLESLDAVKLDAVVYPSWNNLPD